MGKRKAAAVEEVVVEPEDEGPRRSTRDRKQATVVNISEADVAPESPRKKAAAAPAPAAAPAASKKKKEEEKEKEKKEEESPAKRGRGRPKGSKKLVADDGEDSKPKKVNQGKVTKAKTQTQAQASTKPKTRARGKKAEEEDDDESEEPTPPPSPKKAAGKKGGKAASPKKASPKKTSPKKAVGFKLTDAQKKRLQDLKAELSKEKVDSLKEMLKLNNQKVTGTKTELVDRVAEGKVLGALPKCPECSGGKLRFDMKTGKYSCPGYMDDEDFVRCSFVSADVTRDDWKEA